MEKKMSSNKYLKKGDKLFYQGKTKEAMHYYQKAIKENPNNAVAWNNLGLCHVVFRRFEKAIECYERAIAINPKYFLAVRNKKKALMRLKKLKLKESEPKFKNKGEEYLYRKEYGKALKFFNQRVRQDPKDALTWVGRGEALLKRGHPKEGLKSLKKAENLDPSLADDHHFKELKRECERYLNQKASAYRKKGDELVQNKDYEKAVKFYELSLKEDDTSPQTWNNLGVAYVNLFLYKEALRCFDKALALEPEYAKAKENRERCITLYREHKKRLQEFEALEKIGRKKVDWETTISSDPAKYYLYITCAKCDTKFKVKQRVVSKKTKVVCPSCTSIGLVLLTSNKDE